MNKVFESRSPADTKRLGDKLSKLLQPGDVVLLSGELGAGKTCLAQGIGRGLRVAEAVKSSSFVLVNEYNGRLKVYHADLFRLNDPGEVVDLALEEMAQDGVLLIEWPDRAWREMPPERLLLSFEMTGGNGRRITVDGAGTRYEAVVAALAREKAEAHG
ncbi:MAG TPA: tRNA (adenosine(37)-N6)-threonylcarbamoyltransferase complex ATPase subunit type 1 TsaE [Dehalococcoidia bacterium]